jgi:hypothetical protein
MAKPGRIACVTMVRNEPVFLPRWIAHWQGQVPQAQLFILADGPDQDLPDTTADLHVIRLPHAAPANGWEASRWRFLSSFVTALLERFDTVVLNDVDELIVADPALGQSLPEALAEAGKLGVIKPFGIEIMHRTDLEPLPLEAGQPVLGQRRFFRINALYCKPCIVARPVRWSLGGHFSDFPDLHQSPTLFLVHLRAMDTGILLARQDLRRRHVTDAAGRVVYGVAGAPWADDRTATEAALAAFARLDPQPPETAIASVRQRIAQTWDCVPKTGFWYHDHMAKLRDDKSFILPERFHGLI